MRSTAADDSSVSALAITAITSVVLMIPGSTILAKPSSTPDNQIKKYRAVFAQGRGVAWPKRDNFRAKWHKSHDRRRVDARKPSLLMEMRFDGVDDRAESLCVVRGMKIHLRWVTPSFDSFRQCRYATII
jgi:hypothetical protein